MSVTESEKECPLCMEALDWDDLGFFPCSCGYQICRFCWHRIRTDENGLCPACRQAFPDIPVSFNPEISAEELKKQKKRNKERRSNKDQVFKPQDLATLRVVQKNLVFVIGLSSRLTQEDLKKEFAHFGKIIKFVHNKSTAYITYSKPEEAIRAIRTLNASAAHESAVQQLHLQTQLTNGTSIAPSASIINNNNTLANTINSVITSTASATTTATTPTGTATTTPLINSNTIASLNGTGSFMNAMTVPVPPNRLKASLGTTKYCNHFLRSQQCPKVGECMYLHEIAEAEASFTKEQMQAGKHVEYEKKLMDSYLAKMSAREFEFGQPPTSHSRQPTLQPPASTTPQQQLQTIQQQPPIQTEPQQTQPQHPHTQPQPQLQHHQQQIQLQLQQQLQLHMQMHQQQQHQQQLQQHLQKQLSQPQLQLHQPLQQQLQTLQQPSQPPIQTEPQQPQSQLHHQQQMQLQLQQQLQLHMQMHQQQQQQQQLQQHLQKQLSQPQLQLQPTLHQSQSRPQQQQQQIAPDTDSDDDGLDFDPISVSTSALRDLLDQQVQQAKQLQLQDYFQQMNYE